MSGGRRAVHAVAEGHRIPYARYPVLDPERGPAVGEDQRHGAAQAVAAGPLAHECPAAVTPAGTEEGDRQDHLEEF